MVVTNPLGSTTSASATLTVTNNRAPTGTILTPTVGTHYNAGDKITFTGSATDPEDGTLPASVFVWRCIFHHNTHTHLGPAIGPAPLGTPEVEPLSFPTRVKPPPMSSTGSI